MIRLTHHRRLPLGHLLGLAALLLAVTATQAQQPPITLHLVTDKIQYGPAEPIKLQAQATNVSNVSLLASAGFALMDFHILVEFTGPDGRPILARSRGGSHEPGPPLYTVDASGNLRPAVLCEPLPADFVTYRIIDDIRAFYDLTQFGHYTAVLATPLEVFTEAVDNPTTGETRCFLDVARSFAGALTSNRIAFDIVPPVPNATIEVKGVMIEIRANQRLRRASLHDMPVRLYRVADLPERLQPVTEALCPLIWDDQDPLQSGLTNVDGRYEFRPVAVGEYVIIGRHDTSLCRTVSAADFSADPQQPIRKELTAVQNAPNR